MAKELPNFLKMDGDKVIFNETGELVYYIPETYFSDTKTTVAAVIGDIVHTIGIFDWALVDTNGKHGKAHQFKYPTMIECRPSRIEKVKGLSLNGLRPMDYRILHFAKGDEAISDINLDKDIDNVEIMFKMLVLVENKIPSTIPYDKFQEYFPENMELNAKGYGLSMQMFGIMISELCRDPEDLSKPFRLSKKINDSMYGFRQISVIEIPKYISPFTALTSQNWDDSLMSAITMSQEGNTKVSPLERVVTG